MSPLRALRFGGAVVAGVLLTLALVGVIMGDSHNSTDNNAASSTPSTTQLVATPTQLMAVSCPGRPPALAGVTPEDIMPSLDQHWKLQLPCQTVTKEGNDYTCSQHTMLLNKNSGTPGVATIYPRDLAGFSLIPQAHDGGFCSGGFYAAQDDAGTKAIAINDPVAGTTTGGSMNPRVELREMRDATTAGGFPLWDYSQKGSNTMTFTQRIMHLPATFQSTTVAQVFNGGFFKTDVNDASGGGPFIEIMTRMCDYSWQKLPDGTSCKHVDHDGPFMMIWRDGNVGGKGGMVLGPYTVGTKFSMHVEVPGDGTITFTYSPEGGDVGTWTLDCNDVDNNNACLKYAKYGAQSNALFFKTGSYVQQAEGEVAAGNAADYVFTYLYSAELTYAQLS